MSSDLSDTDGRSGMLPGPGRSTLAAIITTARAGGLDHAWAMFRASGYDDQHDQPAALAVKGRLLKDSAQRLPTADRAPAFAAAAATYAQATSLAPQPYTMINVATLNLLAGNRDAAIAIAKRLVTWLDRDDAIQETPYYLEATRAEAMLLCGTRTEAEAALGRAIGHDPDGWSDHASTLHQFKLILDATGQGTEWLDRYRPPHSLYFGGHLGVASDGCATLRSQVMDILDQERVGFGYGALAAGSDIVIAEAVLARGAELHVVLPVEVEEFAAQSVVPFGEEWRSRFDRCLDGASSLRIVTHVTGDYEPLATLLAADVAMGSAVLNARQLESKATQLLVIDEGEGPLGMGVGMAQAAQRWMQDGCHQHVIRSPRTSPVLASGYRLGEEGRPDRRLAAMLHITFDGIDALDDGQFAEAVDSVLTPFREACARVSVQPALTLPAGNARIVAFALPEDAWSHARALLALVPRSLPLRITGHYALAHWLESPPALVGRGIAELEMIAGSAIPGVLTVSETLASALFVSCDPNLYAEWVGEAGDIRLFAVTARRERQ